MAQIVNWNKRMKKRYDFSEWYVIPKFQMGLKHLGCDVSSGTTQGRVCPNAFVHWVCEEKKPKVKCAYQVQCHFFVELLVCSINYLGFIKIYAIMCKDQLWWNKCRLMKMLKYHTN
jgi:hypothetical protein